MDEFEAPGFAGRYLQSWACSKLKSSTDVSIIFSGSAKTGWLPPQKVFVPVDWKTHEIAKSRICAEVA